MVEEFFLAAQDIGQKAAEAQFSRRLQRRVNLSLYSDVYRARNLPIRHLILDEVQFAKNDRSQTHKAVKALPYARLGALSGTFVANKWSDLFGILHLMPGENPFNTARDFHRVYGNPHNKFSEPTQTRLNRLIKTLQALTIARPSSILDLPGLHVSTFDFHLNSLKDIDMVLYLTKLFVDTLRKAKRQFSDVNGILVSPRTERSILYATRAQQWAAHSALVPRRRLPIQDILDKMQALVALFDSQTATDEPAPQGAHRTRMLMDFISEGTQSGLLPDDPADKDFDPMKDLDDDDDGEDADDDENAHMTQRASTLSWTQKIRNMPDEELFSSRIRAICEVYARWLKENPVEKIVIFSKFRKFLDLLAEALRRSFNVEPFRFDGTKNSDQRTSIMDGFRTSKGVPLLITPRSGGAGLNIEFAAKLIQCEVVSHYFLLTLEVLY